MEQPPAEVHRELFCGARSPSATRRGVPSRDAGRDDHQDCGHHDGDDPTDPVDAGAAVAAEGGVDEPSDDHATDAAEHGEPDRDVVLVPRSDELAEQADDDARDDDADDLHAFLPCGPFARCERADLQYPGGATLNPYLSVSVPRPYVPRMQRDTSGTRRRSDGGQLLRRQGSGLGHWSRPGIDVVRRGGSPYVGGSSTLDQWLRRPGR